MICLVRSSAHADVLAGVRQSLQQAIPGGAPHTFIDMTGWADLPSKPAPVDSDTAHREYEEAVTKRVRELLVQARNNVEKFTLLGEPLHFALFSRIDWLMSVRLDPDNPDAEPETQLRRLLHERSVERLVPDWIRRAGENLQRRPWWWQALLGFLEVLTWLVFRLRISGRMPMLSGPYRWFLRQPDLAPDLSGTFPRFACRLTETEWPGEDLESLVLLMVNAFLEDLRRAYRLPFWKLWRARRTTYAVLLLDNITAANGGYQLLESINDVRNQTGTFDPLLVVSAGADVPPDDRHTYRDRPRDDAAGAANAYRSWQNALLTDRRRRKDITWYLPIRINDDDPPDIVVAARQKWSSFDGYRFSDRAAQMGRAFRLGVAFVVVVACVAAISWRVDVRAAAVALHRQQHCGTDVATVVWEGDECIGVYDGAPGFDLFQPSDNDIRTVESTIYRQNQQAVSAHREAPHRPYLTVVSLQALTSSTGKSTGLTAEREVLEGIAVAQARQLHAFADSDPILRVLIGSAGKLMDHGRETASLIGQLAAADDSVVAVLGLGMSTKATAQTITALTTAGIPMVSALTADTLSEISPLYFQVTPQNEREAAMVSGFADDLLRAAGADRQVRIYYSDDPTDLWSGNLRDDALRSFHDRGFTAEEAVAFTQSGTQGHDDPAPNGDRDIGSAAAAGRDTCSFGGVAFFVGRSVPDFGTFLEGAAGCDSAATIIGADDVTRYVADDIARGQTRTAPYYYVSFSNLPGRDPHGTDLRKPAQEFLYGPSSFTDLFRFEQPDTTRRLDDNAELGFDSAQVIIRAASYLRDSGNVPVTRGTIWREITAIHTSRPGRNQINNVIEGATGTIDFGGDITRQVPQDKPIAIYRVINGSIDLDFHKYCEHTGKPPSEPWCP